MTQVSIPSHGGQVIMLNSHLLNEGDISVSTERRGKSLAPVALGRKPGEAGGRLGAFQSGERSK